MYRIKFIVAFVLLNERIHSIGDVVEVDEDQFKRLVKTEKAAKETDEELTVFPEPAEPSEAAMDEPSKSPDGGQGGAEKATTKGGSTRR